MALFSSKKRAARGAARTGEGTDPAWAEAVDAQAHTQVRVSAAQSAAAKGLQGPLEQLVALHTSNTRFKRLAGEALKVILEALHVRRGALLVFDTRDQTLVLAASRGIGEEGRQRLRRVRRNDPESWDIPLHGLLAERAYLIDNPADNRFVPELVENGNRTLARIACIPMFRHRTPIGTFVLLAGHSERLAESEIRLSQVWLKYLAAIIDELREREGMAALGESDDEDGPGATRHASDAADAVAAVDASGPEAPPVPVRDAVEGDGSRASILLTEVVAPRATTGPEDGEVAALRQQLATLRSERAAERSEMLRLREEAAAAAARIESSREEVALEHDRTLIALRTDLRRNHERSLSQVQAERDRYCEEVATLTATIDSSRGALVARSAEAAALKVELDRARRSASEAAAGLAGAQRRLEEQHARTGELEQTVAAMTQARDEATGRARRAEAAASARSEELETLRAELAQSRAQTEERARTIQELKARAAAVEAEQGSAREELRAATERVQALEGHLEAGDTRTTALATELRALEDNDKTHRRAISELTATVARLEAVRHELEGRLADAQQRNDEGGRTISQLTATVGNLQSARGELVAQVAAMTSKYDAAAARITELSATVTRLDAECDHERERCRALGQRAEELQDAVAAREHGDETSAATVRAAVERAVARREHELRGEFERARAESQTRQGEIEDAMERLLQESQTLRERLTRAEELARERSAEGAVAADRVARLTSEHAAERAAVEGWREKAEMLTKRVAALEQAVEVATAEVAGAGEQVTAAQHESARWQEEARTSGARIAALERAAEESAASTAALERRARAMTEEAERWRRESEARGARLEALEFQGGAGATRAKAAEAGPPGEPPIEGATPQRSMADRGAAAGHLDAEDREPGEGEDADLDPSDVESGDLPRTGSVTVLRTDEPLVVVEPNVTMGEALTAALGPSARMVTPKDRVDTAMRAVADARATGVVINVGTRGVAGGFNLLRALRQANPALRVWAYAAPPNANKAIPMGFVEWLPHPVDRSQLVGALGQLGGRGTRALSVGFDMQLLLGVRKHLAQQGISLSMACDSKQGQELQDMVNPHAILVDLDLPRGDGYRAIGRLAGHGVSPTTWVLCGGGTPPAEAGSLVVTAVMERSASAVLKPADLAKICRKELLRGGDPGGSAGKGRARARTTTGGGRSRESGARGARSMAQRRSPTR
jgi:DNA-binding response OmpR family regulator